MEQNAENNSIPEQKTLIEETKQPKVKKQLPIGAVLKTILIIVVIAGTGVGGFYAYKYIKRVDNDIVGLRKDATANNTKVRDLDEITIVNNSRIDSIVSQQASNPYNYSTPTPIYANLNVEKVLEDKNAALESGFRFLLVDVKLVNINATDVYFSASELKLKDADSYEYGFYSNNPYGVNFIKKDTNVLFPDNRLPLDFASLKPNEAVKGTIVYVLNRPGSKFTLYRNGTVLKDISL